MEASRTTTTIAAAAGRGKCHIGGCGRRGGGRRLGRRAGQREVINSGDMGKMMRMIDIISPTVRTKERTLMMAIEMGVGHTRRRVMVRRWTWENRSKL